MAVIGAMARVSLTGTSRAARNVLNHLRPSNNNRPGGSSSLRRGRSSLKHASNRCSPIRSNLSRGRVRHSSSSRPDRSSLRRNGRTSRASAISSNGNPVFNHSSNSSGKGLKGLSRSSLDSALSSLNGRNRIVRKSRRDPGSNNEDGNRGAPGRDMTTGKAIAPGTGLRNIGPGRSAAGTAVTTFPGISSACISARGIISGCTRVQ